VPRAGPGHGALSAGRRGVRRGGAGGRRALRAAGIDGDYVALAPFTTRPQKHWLDDRWAECTRRLAAERGVRVVVLGGPGDRDHAAALVAQAGPVAVSLAGGTSLGEAAAVIRGARLLVGVDTGLTHLGLAMGTPTLALFGSTRPYLDPAAPNARVLYEPMDCSPCRAGRPAAARSPACAATRSPRSSPPPTRCSPRLRACRARRGVGGSIA